MSDTLETILDKYLKLQENILFGENAVPDDKESYKNAVKKELSDQIYSEIQKEVEEKALENAEQIIEKKAGLRRINEFKKLTIDGLIVAFFVGLLVNQATDIIGFFKGTVSIAYISPTIISTLILLLICISIIFILFISEILKILRMDNNEGNQNWEDI